MDVAMNEAFTEEGLFPGLDGKDLFCGQCYASCGTQSGFHGRWQKITCPEKMFVKWIYLCRGCDNALWRLFSKLENFLDDKERRQEWNKFLMRELSYN